MNNKKVYILYEYNKFKNDFEYIKEYYNKNDILKDVKLRNKYSINHYVYDSINDIKQLLNDRFIIIKEVL